MTWTSELDATLLAHLNNRLSAAEAGMSMGITRNSALSRARQLGYSFRGDEAARKGRLSVVHGKRADEAWSPEASALAAKLYREGKSGAEIARQVSALGRKFSRQAVAGHLHRKGVIDPHRSHPKVRRNPVGNFRKPTTDAFKAKKPLAKSDPQCRLTGSMTLVDVSQARPWITRKRHECAWPIGTPEQPADQLTCCAPTHGLAYCPHHMAVRHGRVPAPLTDRALGLTLKAAPKAQPTFADFEQMRA